MSTPTPPPDAAAATYTAAAEAQIADAEARLGALEAAGAPFDVAHVLVPLNDLFVVLDAALNRAGLYRSVHPDAAVRAAANVAEQRLSELSTRIGLSRPLYEALGRLELAGEDAVTQRYVKHLLRDLRRAGVDQDDAARARIRALRDALVGIGQSFDKNVREDVRHVEVPASALAGLPADYVAAHPPAGAGGTVTLSTNTPDYLPFMSYSADDGARLRLYRAFRQRGAPANRAVLQQMLASRHELAQLLGYPDWATYITEDKMIGSAAAAQAFIDRIDTLARPRAQADYDALLARLRAAQPGATAVGDWQKAFIEEQVKRDSYHFDAQAARAFFPFGRVRDGLLEVTGHMFGLDYERAQVPTWHPSVVAYDVFDRGQNGGARRRLGRFYLDLHPRPDKYQHAAAFPIRTGLAGRQEPEAALVCNFPAGEDALMEHDEVQTFFHEFGHLLHHLFASQQRWIGVSGISTEWDFVEAPSQMLEEWTFDPATLRRFARNAAGETIGTPLIEAMRRARDFGRGLWVTHQMFYAAASLQLHRADPEGLDTGATMQALQRRYSLFAPVPDTQFELSFGHLEGYSAIYYTYMWSLVIAKDLFSRFAAEGLLDPAVAGRYREQVLAPGGSADAADLVHNFLGRPFSFDAFGRWMDGR